MANFEYIDEAEAVAEEEPQKAAVDSRPTVNSSERTNYWEELLRDKYEVHKVEEFNALGKGKRSRKQVLHYSCTSVILYVPYRSVQQFSHAELPILPSETNNKETPTMLLHSHTRV